eukprot:6177942-Pleurochrysis_carterae.AAC.1
MRRCSVFPTWLASFARAGQGEEDITEGRYPTYLLRARWQRDRALSLHAHNVAARWHALWLCFNRPPSPDRGSRGRGIRRLVARAWQRGYAGGCSAFTRQRPLAR